MIKPFPVPVQMRRQIALDAVTRLRTINDVFRGTMPKRLSLRLRVEGAFEKHGLSRLLPPCTLSAPPSEAAQNPTAEPSCDVPETSPAQREERAA
jgi:hypothetical protein